MKKQLSLFFTIVCIYTIQLQAQPSFIIDSLNNYIEKGIKDWQIPGLAIVIVKDGKTVVMKGFGKKDILKQDAVDEHTLFMIASNTKLFTGTALANLEYNKKLSLDDKITKYYENFKLYNDNATDLVTIRDMLSHRIGTKTFQGDFTFFDGNLNRKEIMYAMRYLKPTQNFRQDYGYCNSCFLTAGEIIPIVTKQPWEVYVYDSIIMPLNMQNTHTLSAGIERRENVAKPYTTSFTGTLQQVPYDTWDNLGPAASIVSSVYDLSHWLQFQLDSGKYAGKQVMPWKVLQKTRDVNIITSSRKSSLYPIHFRGYGLGVFTADYNGKQIFWHTGGASGMVSNVCFVPEENLGIAILTNNDNQNFFELLRYQILDAYLGVPYVNRSLQQLNNFNKEENEANAKIMATKARLKNNLPNIALSNYEGTYTNQLYGKIVITAKDNKLNIDFKSHNALSATLQYLDNDEWLLEYNNILYGIFTTKFVVENSKVISLNIKANDFVEYDAYTFVKQ